MIEWINFVILIKSTTLMAFYYIKSVSPAKLEEKRGEVAYKRCGIYRVIASFFELITIINYIL